MVTVAMKLRHSSIGKKAMTTLDDTLKKQRHYFATKACILKAMVFPVVIYRCESWAIKKAES